MQPLKERVKWFALLLICLYVVGYYYCYDMPAILQTSIMDFYGITNTRFSLMYSCYSLPNLICPLFGGILIDKIGNSKSVIACTLLAVIGQLIITYGAHKTNYSLMLFGRSVFGIGTETLMLV